MPVIVCENKDCKHISKRRTRFLNSFGHEALCHTCKADLVNIRPVKTGDGAIGEHLGYIPYECVGGRKYHDQ